MALKIISLQAERFKRLSAVEITPKGNTVIISGRNGQGKSSVLDAIWLALGGAAAAKECGAIKPIKDGEKDAVVKLDLGEMKITRRWKANGTTTLEVTSSDGKRFKSEQTLLDGLVGKMSFDPLAFAKMDAKEQRKQLISLLNLSIDIDAEDKKRKDIYDERTYINRDLKALEAEFDVLKIPPSGLPTEPVSAMQIMAEFNAAKDVIQKHENKKRKVEDIKNKVSALRSEIEEKQKELQVLTAQGRELLGDIKTESDVLPDIEAINAKLQDIDGLNQKIREKARYVELKNKISAKHDERESKTAAIVAIDEAKEQAFREAKFPISGLAFDEDGITYQGVPFRQCSSAEQLRVCVAIAAALNPTIRVIRVTDASLLDDENMRFLDKLAGEEDIQIFLERVTNGEDEIGFTIENGEVKSYE